jgi:hypothetical protein
MFARVVAKRRLFGFDADDWSLLVAGLALAGLMAMLI